LLLIDASLSFAFLFAFFLLSLPPRGAPQVDESEKASEKIKGELNLDNTSNGCTMYVMETTTAT
jgi:hypothetical protein